jgi:hypothetical protein
MIPRLIVIVIMWGLGKGVLDKGFFFVCCICTEGVCSRIRMVDCALSKDLVDAYFEHDVL